MLAGSGEAWIARDRVAGARAMIEANAGAILMDDGHQNPSLHKDLSLLVIDAAAPFGNGHVLPKGPLREPIKTGLARADALIMMGPKWAPPIAKELGKPVFHARLERITPLPAGPLFAFAGIGNPSRFFDSLRKEGGEVCDSLSYGDHHVYSKRDLQKLRTLAAHHNATLVTTEKDFVRLPIAERDGIIPIKVRAVFENAPALMDMLMPLFEDAKT